MGRMLTATDRDRLCRPGPNWSMMEKGRGSLNGKTAYYIFILGKKKTTIKTPLGIYQEKQDPAKKLRGTIVPDKTANKIFTGCVN